MAAGVKRGRGNLGGRERAGRSLPSSRAVLRPIIPFPFPFELPPRRLGRGQRNVTESFQRILHFKMTLGHARISSIIIGYQNKAIGHCNTHMTNNQTISLFSYP